ncbi:MAG: hypothetical protein ACLFVP_01235 [Candidatus Bathyarchaeia archaeon]
MPTIPPHQIKQPVKHRPYNEAERGKTHGNPTQKVNAGLARPPPPAPQQPESLKQTGSRLVAEQVENP